MLLVLFSLVICCFFLIFMRRRVVSINEPPLFPSTLPFIGHAHLAYGDTTYFLDLLKRISMESINAGGVITLYIGPVTFYVLTDPIDSLTAMNACWEKSEIYKFGKRLFGEGLITADGQTSRTHRKFLNPMFTQQALNRFLVVFNAQARRLVNNLDDKLGKGPFEYEHYVSAYSYESVCKIIMGVDVGDNQFENNDYIRALNAVTNIYIQRLSRPWLHSEYIYSWTSLFKEENSLVTIIRNRCDQVLLKRKEIINETIKHGADLNKEPFRPLVDQMLMSTDEKALTDEEVANEVNNLIAAAYETTSLSLSYTLLTIGANKEVQDRVYKEVENIFEGSERDIEKTDLSKMVYTEAVIKETLRLYPPVPFFCRHTTTDIKLSKYTLRAGSQIVVSALGSCRHPAWGADADQFRPERWLDPASLPDTNNSFPVFGMGKRSCIGRVYALMIIKTTLAHVLRRYKITSHDDNPTFKLETLLKTVTPLLMSLENRN